MRIDEVLRLLRQEYGPRRWKSRGDPMSTLVATVLSQNTSDVNSERAFRSLMAAFDGWQAMAEASPADIARSIRAGGLADIKAGRIKSILREIRGERGDFDLDFLKELHLPEAGDWLRRLPGVGPKTAACVLLFSLGRPALPVDTHVFRVARRLGLLQPGVSADRAHEVLQQLVPAGRVYEFHVHMVEHGRKVCRAQRPGCGHCVLAELCPSRMEPRRRRPSSGLPVSRRRR
ncbi:MAG: endonuclease III [Chloroflexi bacterium]|nr:endonuclease III [Chloroflexota bacterium]